MAKSRGKQKLSDRVANAKVAGGGRDNPFEIHFNRTKKVILGHTVRGDRGRPGISKGKAIEMRKRTLLSGLKVAGRAGAFVDRRMGARAAGLSDAELATRRFTTERKKQSRKDIFNLDDSTQLTHMGLSIDQLDKFEDPRSDEEDDAALSSDFVKQAHFGGGLLSRRNDHASATGDHASSSRDWVQQMIDEGRRRKSEAQRLRDQTLTLTEQLDSEYVSLATLVKSAPPPPPPQLLPKSASTATDTDGTCTTGGISLSQQSATLLADISGDTARALRMPTESTAAPVSVSAAPVSASAAPASAASVSAAPASVSAAPTASAITQDEYDQLVRQLMFSRRVPASDGVKSADRAAQAETDRVRQLEQSRLCRMLDNSGVGGGGGDRDEDGEEQDDGDDDDGGGGKQLARAHISADVLKVKPVPKKKKEQLQLLGDQLSVVSPAGDVISADTPVGSTSCPAAQPADITDDIDPELARLLKWSTFSAAVAPMSTLQQLQLLQQQAVALDPARGPRHRSRLASFYQNCVRLAFAPTATTSVAAAAASGGAVLRRVDLLLPLLYDMTQRLGGGAAGPVWQQLLRRRYSAYTASVDQQQQQQQQRRGRGQRAFPPLSTLLMLRACALLFPASDHRHPITLPAAGFLAQVLSECAAKTCRQLARTLFVISLLVQYTSLSCRLVPEVICTLQSLLFTACAGGGNSDARRRQLAHLVTLPYSSAGPGSRLLLLRHNCATVTVNQWRLSLTDMTGVTGAAAPAAPSSGDVDSCDLFRLRATHQLLSQLVQLARRHQQLPAAAELFEPAAQLAAALPIQWYPECVRSLAGELSRLVATMSAASRLTLARADRNVAKPLPLYEPHFDDPVESKGLDLSRGSGGRGGSREGPREHQRLLRCHRRQVRSTVKEVRRDSALVARYTLDKRTRADKERKTKVKQLMALLGNQEGDFRKMERMKSK